jgi:hypothetical protein
MTEKVSLLLLVVKPGSEGNFRACMRPNIRISFLTTGRLTNLSNVSLDDAKF